MMGLVDAFLMATAWAYLGCLLFTDFGKPPMAHIEKWAQCVFYTIAWIIFMLSSFNMLPPLLYGVLGVGYGLASIGSFIGYPQIWMAYWKDDPDDGSDAGQIGMAFWDLLISVVFFMKFSL